MLTKLLTGFPLIYILCISTNNLTESCSSRSLPRPQPFVVSTPRPNITFHTYKCPPYYSAWYCLNDATCFTVKIGDSLLYNCECADGYMGPRCEYKDLDGSYIPTRPKVLLEIASIASGVTVAVMSIFIFLIYMYIRHHKKPKSKDVCSIAVSDTTDTVDSSFTSVNLRPFGPHHFKNMKMTKFLYR